MPLAISSGCDRLWLGLRGELTAFLALENIHEAVTVWHPDGLNRTKTHGAFTARTMRSGRNIFSHGQAFRGAPEKRYRRAQCGVTLKNVHL
jgi:hypothetical protein